MRDEDRGVGTYAMEQLLRYVVAHEWFEERDRSRRWSEGDLPSSSSLSSLTSVPYRLRADEERDQAWCAVLKHADWIARRVQLLCAAADAESDWTAVAVSGADLPLAVNVLPPEHRYLVHDHTCTTDCWDADACLAAAADERPRRPIRIVIASTAPGIADLASAMPPPPDGPLRDLLRTAKATERVLPLPTSLEFMHVQCLGEWRNRLHQANASYAYKLHFGGGTSMPRWRLHVMVDPYAVLGFWLCKLQRRQHSTAWKPIRLTTEGTEFRPHRTAPPATAIALRRHFYGVEPRDHLNRSITDYLWMNALRYEAYRHTVANAIHPLFYPPQVFVLMRRNSRPRNPVSMQLKIGLDWMNFMTAMNAQRDAALLAWRVEVTRHVMGDVGPANHVDRQLDMTATELSEERANDKGILREPWWPGDEDENRDGAGGVGLRLITDSRKTTSVSVRLRRHGATVVLPLLTADDARLCREIATVLTYRDAPGHLLSAYLSFVRYNQRMAKTLEQQGVEFELFTVDAECVRRLLRCGYRIRDGEIIIADGSRNKSNGGGCGSTVSMLRQWAV